MLVLGDRTREVVPHAALREISDPLAAGHGDEALIEAGALAQGLADHEFQARGFDDLTPLQDALTAMAVAVARAALGGDVADAHAALRRVGQRTLPPRVPCRVPEGFAFYAVYPQAYAAAARGHAWGAPPLVLGLRSIGLTLGAVVAAATGGQLLTLRPTGHPFRRTLEVSGALRARIAGHEGPVAVVDEGPGLSGSSFGCVGDLLETLGVSQDRVVFMPSHPGPPGPQADPRHRARWDRTTRVVRTLDDLLAIRPIGAWFEPALGPAAACEDLSGGAWRASAPPMNPAPPADAPRERRKFRLRSRRGTFCARFAGLGRSGREKFERARTLHAGGFGPEPVALVDGFLLEKWVEGSSLDLRAPPARLLPGLAAYLRLRRARFAASADSGAGAERLLEMGRTNAEALCGPVVARRLVWPTDLGGEKVHVDGRLHAWEWRVTQDGLCKLDGLDHSCGHDLVGAQDIAWDVAGAGVELRLDEAATQELAKACGADPSSVRAYRQLYAAFQGGLWAMAEEGAAPADRERIHRWRARYARELARLAET